MDSIIISVVPKNDAKNEIKRIIDKMYSKEIDQEIEDTITELFDELTDKLAVCIEYPYVDKVYRDSFYHYFASKHNEYHRDCIRVTLFKKPILSKHFRDEGHTEFLQENFLGYIVIRPTFPSIIGRTIISKDAMANSDFVICQSKGEVLINGIKLTISGFPFASQDVESVSCAETCIWAIMEYFGTKYPDYQPALPSRIISVLNKFSNQRMLPSNGLNVEQISFTLKEFGFGTYIYSKEIYKAEFPGIIATYIESGIPIIATLENSQIAHAILIVGHETDKPRRLSKVKTIKYGRKQVKYFDYNDIPKKYVVQDDNLTPYKLVKLTSPSEHYKNRDEAFLKCEFESIVVPLYSKIYLEAGTAKKLLMNILTDKDFGFVFPANFVMRFFLTSSRSFKHHIALLSGLNSSIKDILILAKMPKFVWCGEFYSNHGFRRNQASGIIVIDATEASEIKHDALIFAGYPDRCIVKLGKNIATMAVGFNIYTKFKNNLL